MTLKKILSARWTDKQKTIVSGEATIEGQEKPWPFCVFAGYDTPLGLEIWEACKKFKVLPFDPSFGQDPALEKWKIEAALLEAGFDPEKDLPPILKAKWRSESRFLPEDELLQQVFAAVGADAEQTISRARELG